MSLDQSPITWEVLYNNYLEGYFPMADELGVITWHNPRHRAVFDINAYQPKKSLRCLLNAANYTVKINENFDAVINECSKPRNPFDGQWLTQSMISAYIGLHHRGLAHSVEIFKENTLIGGLYGVQLGAVFFGESMFSHASNASKIAFHHLMLMLRKNDFMVLDSQYLNDHTEMLGAIEIPQEIFLTQLRKNSALTRQFILE
jgi:leucyl/phenylalanyl-tRNA--protein transferase